MAASPAGGGNGDVSTHFFKDRRGRVVIGQAANPPLLAWFILVVINYFVHSAAIAWLATAFLFTWAFLELYQGVNYFRRILGLIVFVSLIVTHFT